MDYVADSDSENALPQLPLSAVDAVQVRSVYAVFSEEIRNLLRQQARDTPFAVLYDDFLERELGFLQDIGESRGESDSPAQIDLRSENEPDAENGQGRTVLSHMEDEDEVEYLDAREGQADMFSLDLVNGNITAAGDQETVQIPPQYPEIPESIEDSGTSASLQISSGFPVSLESSEMPESIAASVEPSDSSTAPPLETPSLEPSVPPPPMGTNTSGIRSRSLRKRTFASRHPYIADKADWLGICTHDSINEMFDGDEDVSRVNRALNQLYLQKRRRFPDEDRYRPKDFYAHLGHSKSQGTQGDSYAGHTQETAPEDEADAVLRHEAVAYSGERNYDPNLHSSQIQQSADEDEDEYRDDELIPYDAFDLPYTQENTPYGLNVHNTRSDDMSSEQIFSDRPVPSDPYTDGESEGASGTESDSETEPEQYIKIGGRMRKVSTILRGVLPESAKRLAMFESQNRHQAKRRKVAPRQLTPRKGLAMKKVGSAKTQSADLERELLLDAQADSDSENWPPREPMQQLITPSALAGFERPHLDLDFPSLSRSSTAYMYASDTPEPQYISSGSDSEPEVLFVVPGRENTAPVSFNRHLNSDQTLSPSLNLHLWPNLHLNQPRQNRPSEGVAHSSVLRDAAEIDPLVARPDVAARQSGSAKAQRRVPRGGKSLLGPRTGAQKRSKNAPPRNSRSGQPRQLGQSLYRQLARAPKVSLGRPAGTQRSVRRTTAGQAKSRRPKVLDKIQSRLPAFRQAQHPNHVPDPANNPNRSKPKPVPKKKDNSQAGLVQTPIEQHFRRGPVVSTFAIEAESTKQSAVRPPEINDSVIHRFQPTRHSLLHPLLSNAYNSLAGFSDLSSVSSADSGRLVFPGEDSVTVSFMKKQFFLALYSPVESLRNATALLNSLRNYIADPKLLLKFEVQSETRSALRGLIKWFLICRDRPPGSVWGQLKSILDGFSKLQTRDVRLQQVTIQSQFIFLYWILHQHEQGHKPENGSVVELGLEGYCVDFFAVFLSSVSAETFSSAYAPDSPSHPLFECTMLIFTIFENRQGCWWPSVTQAVEEMVVSPKNATGLLDVIYLLAAILPRKSPNWGPFLAVLGKLKDSVTSLGHRHFIDTCELAKQRLGWNYDDKVIRQLYAVFGARKFCNFEDESSIPASIGLIRTRLDIPQVTVFERFLSVLYTYISELSLAKEVKKLLSKFLASTKYLYTRERKSQIIFVNRLNLIVLLSQISNEVSGSQLDGLITLICDSADPFLYGKSIDALKVICEAKSGQFHLVPSQAFIDLLKSLADICKKKPAVLGLYLKLIDLMGLTFCGISDGNQMGVFVMLEIFTAVDLVTIPDSFILEVIGTVYLSMMEMELASLDLSFSNLTIVADFQKSLLKLLGAKMETLPISNVEADRSAEEIIELGIQMWILLSKVSRSKHWNVMMYQRFSYLGNSISRHRFVMFFCIEFMHSGPLDLFVLQEIERMFLVGLLSPTLSKYAVDLYRNLSQNPLSIYWSKESRIPEISSAFSLKTSRLRIITKALEKMARSTLHSNEKSGIISSFVKRLHDIYTESGSAKGVTEMCKRIAEIVVKTSNELVANLDEFWELSSKLGLPNKSLQNKWATSGEEEKVKLINVEFVTAIVYGKNPALVMDNWKQNDNDLTLYSLIEAYAIGLELSKVYWAHLALLLEYFLAKLENFQIASNHRNFQRFLLLLKSLSVMSSLSIDYSYALYEIRALDASCLILKHAVSVFDGYNDQQDVKHVAFEFLSNIDVPCPQSYRVPASFLNLSMDLLRNGVSITYHPKFQHTAEEYQDAVLVLKESRENFSNKISGRADDDLKGRGMEYFECF